MIDVKIPKWKITDPFGRDTIARLCHELKREKCNADGYRVELEETLKAKSETYDKILKKFFELTKQYAELDRRYEMSEEARKSLGEKIRRLRDEIDRINGERAKLRIEYERYKEAHPEGEKT